MLHTYALGLCPIFEGLSAGPGGLADVLTCIQYHAADRDLKDSTTRAERLHFR